MDTARNGNWKRSILAVLLGLLTALLLLLLLGALFAICLTFTSLSEGTISATSLIFIAISLLAGGIVCALFAHKKGLYHGLALGICFFLILIFTSQKAGNIDLVSIATKGAAALVAACLGGILGIKKS